MDFFHHTRNEQLSIRSVGEKGILIAETWHCSSLLITGSQLIILDGIRTLAEINNTLIENALKNGPDVVLIGTGQSTDRPSRDQYLDWQNAGVGIEVMDTHAASRTFNTLLSEGRPATAILIPPEIGNSKL